MKILSRRGQGINQSFLMMYALGFLCISFAPLSYGNGKQEFTCPLISSTASIPQLEKPALLLFYASWCPMCHQMVEAFNAFMQQYPDLQVYRIDVGGSGSAIGQKFGVSGVPTLVAVENGKNGLKEMQRFVGKLSLSDLQRRVAPVVCPVK